VSLNLVYAFCALLIALSALLHGFLPKAKPPRPLYSLLLMTAAVTILLLPANGAPVFYYLRGYLGDFSVSASVFFGAYILNKGWGIAVYREKEQRAFFLSIGLLGICLYPLALGATQYDPYRLGYHPHALLTLLFFLGLYIWYRKYYFLLFTMTAGIIGFTARLLESNNLWDYLLDGVFWLACITLGIMSVLKGRKSRRLQ